MGRAAEVHGEGEDEVPHLAVLPQEDHALRGQQVRQSSAVYSNVIILIWKVSLARMFVWSLEEGRVLEQAVITIPTQQAAPLPKLNVQNRCPAKIKLEEFQEEDV